MALPVKDLQHIVKNAQSATQSAFAVLNVVSQHAVKDPTGNVVELLQLAKLQGMLAIVYGGLEAVRIELGQLGEVVAAADAFAGAVTCPACTQVSEPTQDGRCTRCGGTLDAARMQ